MYGLILAGGSGSRLWPLSRELYPKQLLNIQNTESLLQATFERLEKVMPSSNIISMTGVKHLSNVKYQLSKITQNPVVLSEPISKNTAPAIDINELMAKQHDAFLKTPKIGADFPHRTFDIPSNELETHNQFMEKLLKDGK